MNKKPLLFLLIVLLNCTKSGQNNSNNSPKPIIVSYTVTDTLGAQWTFSDTSYFKNNQYQNLGNTGTESRFPCAIVQNSEDPRYFPDTFDFVFGDFKTVDNTMGYNTTINSVELYLPFYQSSLSEQTKYNNSLFTLVLNATPYKTDLPNIYPQALTQVNMKTTISDSSGNSLSGSFRVTAVTQFSKTITVSGVFKNIPTNFRQ